MDHQILTAYLQLSPDNFKRLKRHVKYFQFERSGPVIHKGQSVSGAYLVLEGRLRVYTYSPQGTEATLYLLCPGDTCILTLNCLFNNLRYPAWVEAEAGSRVALIPGDLYRQLFAEEESVRNTTIKGLSTLVFRLMDELEEVHACNLEQRLVRHLLNNASADGVVLTTQQMLANHLGTTREVIARLMQNLNSQGLISTGRGRILIQDTVQLAAMVTPSSAQWP
ncbi:MAG: Crp/Fnr family transcriptional regulator [Gammaproteobacteria bacterium]|nr:Crp/Fnr family transcriptional regulator [Gammaproteobacteria bacterium]